MDILFTQRYLPERGGSISWLSSLFKDWPHKLIVFTNRYDSNSESAEQNIIRKKILLKNWGLDSFDSLIKYFRMFFTLFSLTRKKKEIRIHCTKLLPEGFVAILLKKINPSIKIIIFVHGEELNAYNSCRQLKFLSQFTFKRVDLLICNSNFTSKKLSEFCNFEQNVEVLNPCINLSDYQLQVNKNDLRQKYSISDQAIVILSLGRLVAKKNFAAVIKELSQSDYSQINYKYLIVGKGPEEDNLKKLVSDNALGQKVEFLSELDETAKKEVFALSDIFVSPSIQVAEDLEGFGIVYLEAAASGLAIIAGNSGGEADAMEHDYNGYRIQDQASLAKALSNLISKPQIRENFSKNSLKFVNQFDYKASQAEYLNLIRS